MNRRTSLVYSLICILVLTSFQITNSPALNTKSPSESTQIESNFSTSYGGIVHDPISIDSNEDLESMGFPGNGTEQNPFRIENLTIIAMDSTVDCISISNTFSWFVIRNCSLRCSFAAINLVDVRNAIIQQNEIYGISTYSSVGIYLFSTQDVLVENNLLEGNERGVHCEYSQDLIFQNNTLTSCGWGIHLEWGNNCNVSSNHFNNCTAFGVRFDFSNYSQALENVLFGAYVLISTYSGIILQNSNHNLIRNNTIESERTAIDVIASDHNEIKLNRFINNRYGIELDNECSENLITLNSFLPESDDTVLEPTILNSFVFNYWYDYDYQDEDRDGFGDFPYQIHGGFNFDPYPLMNPPGSVEDAQPPSIIFEPPRTEYEEHEWIVIEPEVYDTSEITQVILSYSTDEVTWNNISCTQQGLSWVGQISPQSLNTEITYFLYAVDVLSNWDSVGPYQCTIVLDAYPPEFIDDSLYTDEQHLLMSGPVYQYRFSAIVEDQSEITLVTVHFEFHFLGDIFVDGSKIMELEDVELGRWAINVTISPTYNSFAVSYYIVALDVHGHLSRSNNRRFRITVQADQQPTDEPSLIPILIISGTGAVILVILYLEWFEKRK